MGRKGRGEGRAGGGSVPRHASSMACCMKVESAIVTLTVGVEEGVGWRAWSGWEGRAGGGRVVARNGCVHCKCYVRMRNVTTDGA